MVPDTSFRFVMELTSTSSSFISYAVKYLHKSLSSLPLVNIPWFYVATPGVGLNNLISIIFDIYFGFPKNVSRIQEFHTRFTTVTFAAVLKFCQFNFFLFIFGQTMV